MPDQSKWTSEERRSIVVRAPINIALLKYWGKVNEELIIPANDSISITIDDLYAETVVSFDTTIDRVVVNDKPIDLEQKKRFGNVIREFRRLIAGHLDGPPFISIESRTNFATSAGLASSAAGFAAIAVGLAKLGDLDEKSTVRLARLGSGSACRSVLPGFVHWIAGEKSDNDEETRCESLSGTSHWTQLRAAVFELSDQPKDVPSTGGMQQTLATSTLVKHRIRSVVPERVERLKRAIANGDFESMARLTMVDSNQLHAVCLDTDPPLRYLTDDSWRLIRFVEKFNEQNGRSLAAYTFDAGPNCCVFLKTENIPDFLAAFSREFEFENLENCLLDCGSWTPTGPGKLALKKVVVSKVGTPARVVS